MFRDFVYKGNRTYAIKTRQLNHVFEKKYVLNYL